MTEETEEVNMLKDQNCLAAFEEGQFLWPSAKANVGDGDASARGSEDLCFFRLVSGDMHRHTFIGEQPHGFDCVRQRFRSWRALSCHGLESESELAHMVPIGPPRPCHLDRLSFNDLVSISVWKLHPAVGYVPKAESKLTLACFRVTL